MESDWHHYRNDTGRGNVLNCANRYVRKIIVDSLIFWDLEMHIDSFRFDLASIFTRKADGTIDLLDPLALADIMAAMELAGVRLIAEAWDPVTYQLGKDTSASSIG
jgi:isoamylase